MRASVTRFYVKDDKLPIYAKAPADAGVICGIYYLGEQLN